VSNPNTRTVTSTNGTIITLDRYRDGPRLVLVGGAFQYRAFDPPTVELAQQLAGDFTVFRYDRRGRGDSGDTPPYNDRPRGRRPPSRHPRAGGRASVFGNSSGAVLALDAAAAGLRSTSLRSTKRRSSSTTAALPYPTTRFSG
jgi:pimeloyl-ACP methyl ester carboxylesterase